MFSKLLPAVREVKNYIRDEIDAAHDLSRKRAAEELSRKNAIKQQAAKKEYDTHLAAAMQRLDLLKKELRSVQEHNATLKSMPVHYRAQWAKRNPIPPPLVAHVQSQSHAQSLAHTLPK